jgi:nitrate reductase gamma subunit
MRALTALIAVLLLAAVVLIGAGPAGLTGVFGVFVPYVALALFVIGFIWRVTRWAAAPVPFRIPTTSGQQRSLPWVRHSRLDNPSSTAGVIGRMALEVLLFRSLFRNTRTTITPTQRLVHQSDKYLWLAALVMHWSLLIIVIRHLRYFVTPVPAFVNWLEQADAFFQVGAPAMLVTDVLVVAALLWLLWRRLADSQMRYMSLPADYFPLFLLLAVVLSGISMRYWTRVDLVAAKELTVGLVTFNPVVPATVGLPFYLHLFMVSALFAYFPFSKLMHMGGVFLSPTRVLANSNRRVRHVNPWNPEVEVHTYEQWEEEFEKLLKASGIPLEGKAK